MVAPGPTAKGSPVPIVSRRVQRWVEVFAHIKHALCAVYLGVQAFVFLSMSSVDVAATRAFAPREAALTYGALGLAHMHYAMGCWCRRRKKATASIQTISVESSFRIAPPPRTETWREKLKRYMRRAKVSEDLVAMVFTSFELVCQSYQAIRVATFVVDRVFVLVYVVMVALHCIVSPWFLLAQPHLRAKYLLLSWSNSIFSVGLTCLLPLLGLVLPVLKYVMVDPTLGNDPVWATRVLLFSRIAVVTSPFGFVAKITMDLSALVSLRRLQKILVASKKSTRRGRSQQRPPWWLRLYVALCATWGAVLSGLCFQALFFRHPCPVSCVEYTTPLFDLSCQCKYLHIDCHALHNEALDLDRFLDPADIGTTLFILQVSRCDVPNGVSNTSLAHQSDLFAITLQFTKMQTWSATLPPTITSIVLRQCAFSSIPDALQAPLPAPMRILIVESTPVASLPPRIDEWWQPLASLQLVNTSLPNIPMSIALLPNLTTLSLFNNRIASVPMEWQTRMNALQYLRSVNLAANNLTEIPMGLRSDIALDLSLNPIASLPPTLEMERLTTHRLTLSHTSYCNESKTLPGCDDHACGHGCLLSMVGDRNCDLGCFNEACQFDGVDCMAYGLEKP